MKISLNFLVTTDWKVLQNLMYTDKHSSHILVTTVITLVFFYPKLFIKCYRKSIKVFLKICNLIYNFILYAVIQKHVL